MTSKRIGICILLLSATFFCQAQKTVIHTNYQWVQYFNQFRFSKKLTLFSDVSFRTISNFKEVSQLTFRTGIGYPLAPIISGVTGVACFNTYASTVKLRRIELRPYQDINIAQPLGKLTILHRFRTEARYFRGVTNGAITSESNFNFRFRYRIFCAIPIAKLSETNSARRLLLNVGDEIFINAGNEIIYNTFDNNRFTVGSTIEYSSNLSFTLNYIYQYGHRNAAELYESSDIFTFVVVQRLAVKKFNSNKS